MACTNRVTRITRLLYQRKLQDAIASVDRHETVFSWEVAVGTRKNEKLIGTVLHISKGKKLSFVYTVAGKKMKRDTTYHRLIFCRLDCHLITISALRC